MTILRASSAPSPRGLIFSLVAMGAALLAAAPVHAQTYSPSVTTSPDIGIIVPDANSSTTFSFASSSGTVSQSGSAVRRTPGTTRAQVTIGCSGGGSVCASAINVKIGSIGTPTGKAGSLSNFNVTAIGSNSISNLSGTNPVSFTITPPNKNTDASFYVGADFPINSSGSAGSFGAATSQFYVYVAKSPTVPTGGTTGTASATTYRGISISGSSMAFGVVSKPASGTATVTLGPSSDVVNVTGGTSSTQSGTSNRAAYTVSGEGGVAITVTVDPSFTMNRTGGGGSFTVTTNNTTLPTSIPGSAGASGTTATFYVGGSFNITSSTAVGNYTGSFNVVASYN